jgi:N-acetylglucosaminyldiphosphoundecaprenol N-acetyl-beta-D-mannosaminyltransferase
VWGAALLGMPITERVAGSDLVPRLVEASATTGWRVHVFGSSQSVADRALTMFGERCPGANVSIDPGPRIPDPTAVDDEIIDGIAAIGADILCVALGNPKQERFIATYRDRLGVPVMMGVGGSLDMFVGERRRAPTWMQRTGTEWIARMAQEPGRLGQRYAHDIAVFGPRLAHEWRLVRSRRNQPGLRVDTTTRAVEVRITSDAMEERDAWSHALGGLNEDSELRLCCGSTTAIRDKALAVLIGLVAHARRRNVKVLWLDDPSPLRPALESRSVPFGLIAWR